jgi:hypothetical protein
MAWDRYVTPFSYGLWLAVAIVICALSVCLVVSYFSHKSNKSLTLIATLFYIPTCFCQQGQHAKPLHEFFLHVLLIFFYSYSFIFFFMGYIFNFLLSLISDLLFLSIHCTNFTDQISHHSHYSHFYISSISSLPLYYHIFTSNFFLMVINQTKLFILKCSCRYHFQMSFPFCLILRRLKT